MHVFGVVYNFYLRVNNFRIGIRGCWVAQSVERPNLDLISCHDLRVVSLSPIQCGANLILSPPQKNKTKTGAWVVQSVKHLTWFHVKSCSQGYESEPHIGSVLSTESA